MKLEDTVVRKEAGEVVGAPWGELCWKISEKVMPGTEMTIGTCHIQPGERNTLHSHPNCEEYLWVVSGICEHRLGDDWITLHPGDVIRIPRNIKHCAVAKGDEPLFAIIVFSSPTREAVQHEA